MAEAKKTDKNRITFEKIMQSDIMVYVMFFVILVICIIIIGKAIGLGSPTY